MDFFGHVGEMCVRVPGAVNVALRFPPQLPAQCPQTGPSCPSALIQQPAREMEANELGGKLGLNFSHSHYLFDSLTPA